MVKMSVRTSLTPVDCSKTREQIEFFFPRELPSGVPKAVPLRVATQYINQSPVDCSKTSEQIEFFFPRELTSGVPRAVPLRVATQYINQSIV